MADVEAACAEHPEGLTKAELEAVVSRRASEVRSAHEHLVSIGRLVAVEPDQLVLEHDGERVDLPRADVTKARLEAEVPWPRKA